MGFNKQEQVIFVLYLGVITIVITLLKSKKKSMTFSLITKVDSKLPWM